MPLATGDPESIGGYALVDRLGQGGMGVVYLARAASGRQVAIKLVHEQYARDEEFRTRFRQEVAAARRVSGAFTAPVVDADPEADRPWMATLYVPGSTLSEVVRKNGPLSGRELRTLGLGLVEALRDIHRAGVVHRDLKPANILMAEDGPRVIDFGISRAVDSQTLTVTIGRVLGTPPFMSPEQLRSPRGVTAASDVFSLGSLLVFAARGSSPFESDSPYLSGYQVMYEHPTLEGVPEPLRVIAERCLAKAPEARPELEQLHRVLRALPDFPAAERVSAQGGEDGEGGESGEGREGGDAAGVEGASAGGPGPGTAHGPVTPHPARTAHGPGATAHGPGAAHGPATTAHGPETTVDGPATAGAGRPPVSPPPEAEHTRPARGARRRLVVTTVGVALGVTGLSVAAAVFAPDRGESSGDPSTTTAHSQPPASLPAGWRPWRTDLRVETEGPPLVYNEPGCVSESGRTVYCGGNGFTIAKVDAANGRVKWRWGSRPQAAPPIGVRDGIVYGYRESQDGRRSVVALDAATEKQRWERRISESATVRPFRGGVLTLSPDSRQLIAYGASGEPLWQSPTPEGKFCEPTVLGGAPYGMCAPTDSHGLAAEGPYDLLRLDPSDGTQRTLTTLPEKTLTVGALQGKPLFVVAQTTKEVYDSGYERPYKAMVRVDPRTGEIKRIPLRRPVLGKPTLLHGTVYFVRPNGMVTAVAADSGRELWQRATETESLSAPVLSRRYGKLYFANRFGRLLALNVDDGKEAWRTSALEDPGTAAQDTEPTVLLVKDAIVAMAGDTVFSMRPDRPSARPSA
ncbi:PQQ-binding-like beta-propeller repeat protein [Streptomyces samsunensis]|uniref:serine/threonine-protein kinase n=1 Tax=Streptomyces malaysiensis TaxID=92644 RepID=UPI00158188BE|nr:serine/threonine-protein kinase [Streptomyces samsunensis]NUH40892.1 PQQ-binding-like beta-propeller repeat protein [Streptomyces samsunensis]